MSGSIFGSIFKVSTFGESHGPAIGCVIDGCPAGIPITQEDIQFELNRRRPGQSSVTTPRKESDTVEILSGVFEDQTTGAPIALLIRNADQRSKDYSNIKDVFRPGHADMTFQEKYGIRDYRGGGRSSGRETACRVAAGALAKKVLQSYGVTFTGYTSQVGELKASVVDLDQIEKNPVRCADPIVAPQMVDLIEQLAAEGDSIGGAVSLLIKGLPVGLGDPVFDKYDAILSYALMSIGTIKGIEFGEGFGAVTMKGSDHNDIFVQTSDGVSTETNHAGGILGGITNGQDVICRLAVKPPSSISKSQNTVTKDGQETEISVTGRHDPCICPRVVPVVEA
ncbi:MAG: chorismate synthase, partial [Candidatus Margulisiibacteriota bacterium]|nr:chorismate synthase [Candidatus Margulisiibacteriota bacterium]